MWETAQKIQIQLKKQQETLHKQRRKLQHQILLVISVSCIPVYIHVQLDVMLSFHVVQHAQIEKCIPRRFCIKQNNHGSGAVIHVLSSRGELRKVGLDPYPTTQGQDPYPTGVSHSFVAAYWPQWLHSAPLGVFLHLDWVTFGASTWFSGRIATCSHFLDWRLHF